MMVITTHWICNHTVKYYRAYYVILNFFVVSFFEFYVWHFKLQQWIVNCFLNKAEQLNVSSDWFADSNNHIMVIYVYDIELTFVMNVINIVSEKSILFTPPSFVKIKYLLFLFVLIVEIISLLVNQY